MGKCLPYRRPREDPSQLIAALLLAAFAPTVEIVAVGDIMPGRFVGKRIDRDGFSRVFGQAAAEEISRADIAFGNLECPLTNLPFAGSKSIQLRAKPTVALNLAKAGFDVLSIANNHALDAGLAGLRDTLSALEACGIRPVGHASSPTVMQKSGVRVAFLAYCDFPNDSGGAGIRYTDESALAANIASVRKRADVVVVSWHWGFEGSPLVSHRQKALARKAVDAGADVVLGHHPHVLQPIEWAKGPGGRPALIAYSLGNFVFDARKPNERETLILHVRVGKAGVRAYRTSAYRIERGGPVPKPAGSSSGRLH